MVKIDYTQKFLKALSRLPDRIVTAATAREQIFKKDPFHVTLRTHKLHGKDKGAWAFSVTHTHRIKFIFLSANHVLFLEIGSHDIYQ